MKFIIEKHKDYINSETLSEAINMSNFTDGLFIEKQDFDGVEVLIGIKKV